MILIKAITDSTLPSRTDVKATPRHKLQLLQTNRAAGSSQAPAPHSLSSSPRAQHSLALQLEYTTHTEQVTTHNPALTTHPLHFCCHDLCDGTTILQQHLFPKLSKKPKTEEFPFDFQSQIYRICSDRM